MSQESFDYGALFEESDDTILESLLAEGSPEEGQRQEKPTEKTEQRQQQRPSGGFQIQIATLQKQLDELEKKIETHKETGVYITKGSDGQSVFDYVSMQQDISRQATLNRRLQEVKERAREAREFANSHTQTVTKFAQAFLRREINSYPPEMRKKLAEQFAKSFEYLRDQGTWSDSMYQDKAKLVNGLQAVMNTALGVVARDQYRSKDHAGKPSGFEEGDEEQPRRKEEPENDDDDFTRALMGAYEKRKIGSMSVAQRRRYEQEQAEKAEKGERS